jgi:hypothetical protein
MKSKAKNKTRRSAHRDIKLATNNSLKSLPSVKGRMKNRGKTTMPSMTRQSAKIEQEYARLFTVPQTPQQSFYADDYSLEQPSALKYVPSTTSPNAEV